jgi:hypothetical protein
LGIVSTNISAGWGMNVVVETCRLSETPMILRIVSYRDTFHIRHQNPCTVTNVRTSSEHYNIVVITLVKETERVIQRLKSINLNIV